MNNHHSLIYCDPAWSYRDKAGAGQRGSEFHYPCMTLDELIEMRSYVDSIAAPDSVLYMWTTAPMMQDALTLMKAWNFTFKTVAFTWIKRTKNNKLFWGMGSTTRSNPEFILYGVRGKGLKRISASVHSVIEAIPREHSRKPDEVRSRLEQLYGDVPRIEMFAREHVEGWDYHGIEVKW